MLKRTRNLLLVLAGLAAIAVGSAALAGAASSPGTTSTQSGPTGPYGYGGQRGWRHHDETQLTGATADKVRQAALAKVPGATVLRLETDGRGAAYEAHLRKSNGSFVTVKEDKNFKVTAVQAFAPGRGGHCGPGGLHRRGTLGDGPPPGAGPRPGVDPGPGQPPTEPI
jgi:hypothetical protein